MEQQYIVVAAEYRGSTGYGKSHYEKIDYGGLEYEDVDSSRKYMLDNYEFVDPERVGIIGWSHGGLITLMNIFNHPENYKVAFAGVPVSDLIARMGYKDMVNLLIEKGAGVPAEGPQSIELMQVAASKGLIKLFTILMDKGVDFNFRNYNNGTLLHSASVG